MRFGNFFVSLTAVSLAAVAAQAATPEEKQAEASATQWLTLVDKGNYGKSWDDAAATFKGNITKPVWEQSLKTAREPLGTLTSRHLKSATYTTSIPKAPAGKYVIIQFDTKFQNKPAAVEIVTPMLDHGVWKVSGYFIK